MCLAALDSHELVTTAYLALIEQHLANEQVDTELGYIPSVGSQLNSYDPAVDYRKKLEDLGVPITDTPTGFMLGLPHVELGERVDGHDLTIWTMTVDGEPYVLVTTAYGADYLSWQGQTEMVIWEHNTPILKAIGEELAATDGAYDA